MKGYKLALIGFFIVASGAFATEPQKAQGVDEAKKADIVKLMNAMGSGDMAMQMMKQMITMLKPLAPDAPTTFWDEFMNEIDPNELIDMIVPIYAKHFTHEDIKGMIAFYETPLGKKTVAKLPLIMQESMQVGQKWGAQLTERVTKKMQAQGKKP